MAHSRGAGRVKGDDVGRVPGAVCAPAASLGMVHSRF